MAVGGVTEIIAAEVRACRTAELQQLASGVGQFRFGSVRYGCGGGVSGRPPTRVTTIAGRCGTVTRHFCDERVGSLQHR